MAAKIAALQSRNDLTSPRCGGGTEKARLVPAAATVAAARAIRHDDFHSDFLEGELIMDQSQELDRLWIRHMPASHFDTRLFAGKLRMRFGTFAIQKK